MGVKTQSKSPAKSSTTQIEFGSWLTLTARIFEHWAMSWTKRNDRQLGFGPRGSGCGAEPGCDRGGPKNQPVPGSMSRPAWLVSASYRGCSISIWHQTLFETLAAQNRPDTTRQNQTKPGPDQTRQDGTRPGLCCAGGAASSTTASDPSCHHQHQPLNPRSVGPIGHATEQQRNINPRLPPSTLNGSCF
ncbi:hypothetical protein VFPPC_17861 [Pochonia chlamydosporia 170]|uniref:Uncharacterized protein n=1 Tax=Pochonia chlamydosporia 170 TaxID=1380566 RepID=A0A219AQ92_METCM|nr:hypothetical protein VFPPC_17861 [Pochonia chlamydosporia 170]OWT42946.1 hypothetical protein VFPPC_17861 [Pochonia chlamydosporia 170]